MSRARNFYVRFKTQIWRFPLQSQFLRWLNTADTPQELPSPLEFDATLAASDIIDVDAWDRARLVQERSVEPPGPRKHRRKET